MTSQTPKALRTMLQTCLDFKPQEHLVIVCHESLIEMGESLWVMAKRVSKEIVLVKCARQRKNGQPLPAGILNLLKSADAGVVLAPDYIPEHTLDPARQDGCRMVIVQNASAAILDRMLNANFNRVSMRSRRLADLFSIAKNLHITSPSGTEVTIALNKTKGFAQTGLANNAGELTSIPAGEASLILDHNVNGKICLDRIAGNRKKLAKPITLHIQKGRISQIKGKKEAELLRKSIRKFGDDGRRLHELGVGTNKTVTLGTSAQEDVKANGTIHISFGENKTTKAQGKVLQAIKGLVLNPTLSVDGKPVIKDGVIQA